MKLGTKIIGNFGGYTELWNGEVVETDPLTKGCVGDYAIDVKWAVSYTHLTLPTTPYV